MDFNLSEEQQMIKDTCRDLGQDVLKPIAAEIDEKHEFPVETVKQMGELGLLGIYIPDEYGGAGMDFLSYALAVEELSTYCASTGVIVSAHTSLACDPILKYGNEEQKKKYLPEMASGTKLGCLGLTEPSAGTDVSGVKTTAVLQGDEYILNGTKLFITNGGYADVAVVIARTDDHPHKGLSAFIVERDFPGYSIGKSEEKLGICASSTTELVFEDCKVPKENLLGELGMGFKVAMGTLNGGRVGIAAQALGIAQASLNDSVAYSKERTQFNKPIAAFQAIQWMIADMATQVDAARLLVYRAAKMKDEGKNIVRESAMAKLYASEAATFCAHKAIQVHGGYGYIREYPVERYYRDARITEIYEGTSEAQRLVISSSYLRD